MIVFLFPSMVTPSFGKIQYLVKNIKSFPQNKFELVTKMTRLVNISSCIVCYKMADNKIQINKKKNHIQQTFSFQTAYRNRK